MQFFGLKWSKLKYIQWIQSKKLGIYIINRLFLAKSHFALFYLVNLLHKLLGPTATSVLMIGCYNFEGLIISSRYNFGPMSSLVGQLFEFWMHSSKYAKMPISRWSNPFTGLLVEVLFTSLVGKWCASSLYTPLLPIQR